LLYGEWHCKRCGVSVCRSCCSKRLVVPEQSSQTEKVLSRVPVCDTCYTNETTEQIRAYIGRFREMGYTHASVKRGMDAVKSHGLNPLDASALIDELVSSQASQLTIEEASAAAGDARTSPAPAEPTDADNGVDPDTPTPSPRSTPPPPATTADTDVVTVSPTAPETPQPTAPSTEICVVCFDKPYDCVFVDCGHMCACLDCAPSFNNVCPYCKVPIQRILKVYKI
jgi:hypothetical protein